MFVQSIYKIRIHQLFSYIQVFIFNKQHEKESTRFNLLQSVSTILLVNGSLYCIILFPLCETFSDMFHLVKSLILVQFIAGQKIKNVISEFVHTEIGNQFYYIIIRVQIIDVKFSLISAFELVS